MPEQHRDQWTRAQPTPPTVFSAGAAPVPVEPANGAGEPTGQRHVPERPDARPAPTYGRAAVPARPSRESTAEIPALKAGPLPPPLFSARRPDREGTRRLSGGWGLSAAGLLVAFIGWGVWAASIRGSDASPFVGFGIVIAVAVGVFVISRLVGRVVLVGLLGRTRRSARIAHAATGAFLATCGVAYLGQTSWVMTGVSWIQHR